jgi:hypothetical protein
MPGFALPYDLIPVPGPELPRHRHDDTACWMTTGGKRWRRSEISAVALAYPRTSLPSQPVTLTKPVTAVYMFCCIPFGLAALLMFRFVRITLGKPALAGERRDVSSARH